MTMRPNGQGPPGVDPDRGGARACSSSRSALCGRGRRRGPEPRACAETALRLGRACAGPRRGWPATPPAERVTGVPLRPPWCSDGRDDRAALGDSPPPEPARAVGPRLLDRVRDGKLDQVQGHRPLRAEPEPRRPGRPRRPCGVGVGPPADMERAVGLAVRVEADRLAGTSATLRRIAAMTPLLGLLGTLMADRPAPGGLGRAGARWPGGRQAGAGTRAADGRGRAGDPGPGRLRWPGRPGPAADRRPGATRT